MAEKKEEKAPEQKERPSDKLIEVLCGGDEKKKDHYHLILACFTNPRLNVSIGGYEQNSAEMKEIYKNHPKEVEALRTFYKEDISEGWFEKWIKEQKEQKKEEKK